MKHLSTTLVTFAIIGATMAQVPNASFENWTGNVPDNWSNTNIAPLNSFPVTPSADAHSGALAARGEVLENPIFNDQVTAPYLQTVGGAPVSEDPFDVSGWYQFNPIQSSASFVVGCTVLDVNGLPTGVGVLEIFDATSGYTTFSMPIDYTMGATDPAASVTISFTIADVNDASAIGSWYLVDDIMVGGAQGISDHHAVVADLGEPYPSPMVSSVTIPMELVSNAHIQVEVLDLLGRPVASIANGTMAPGSYRLQWIPESSIPNGVYVIRVSDPSGANSRRVVLQR